MALTNWFKKNNNDDEFDDLDEELNNSYYEPEKKNGGQAAGRDDAYEEEYTTYEREPRRDERSAGDGARQPKPRQNNGFYVPPYNSIPEDDMGDYVDLKPTEHTGERVVETYEAPEADNALYFLPVDYADFIRDSGEIVSGLQDKCPIVICLRKLDKLSIMRVYDFTTGLTMGLDADVFRMGATSIVLAPEGKRVNVNDLTVPAEFLSDAEEDEEDEEEDA